MIILKALLFMVYLFICSYFIGYFINFILKLNYKFANIIILGFISYIALTQLFLWPFVAFRLSKTLFYIFTSILTILPTTFGIVLYFKNKEKPSLFNKLKINKSNIKEFVLLSIVIIMVLVQIILTAIYFRYDDDDSFYVSNSTLFLNSDTLNEYDSSFGDPSLGTVPMYDFQIWETVISYWSYLFKIEPVILSHTVLIPILIIITTIALYCLGKFLLKGRDKAYIFLIILMLFTFFSGYSTHSFGSRILSRIWQGKTLYLVIILPMVVTYILNFFETSKKNLTILTLICSVATIGLNPTGMYIIGFEILFLMIAICIYKKDFRLFLCIIPSAIYILIFALLIFFRTSQFGMQIDAASHITYLQIIDIQREFYAKRSFIYLILYIASCIFILKKGTINQKFLLVFTPILILIFILNPITGKFVAEKITKTATFWRVYWLVPFQSGIGCCIALLIDYIKDKKLKLLIIASSIFLIILGGEWLIDSSHGFMKATNLEKLPEESIEFGKIISKDENNNRVIAKKGINTKLRQKYSNIFVLYNRYQYMLDLIKYRGNDEDAEKRIILQEIIDGNTTDYTNLEALLNEYNIKWIITGTDNILLISKLEYLDYSVLEVIENSCLLVSNSK